MVTVIFRPRASLDVDDLSEYLEEKAEGLGNDFVAAVASSLDSLRSMPEAGATIKFRSNRVRPGLRAWLVKGFPKYVIYYRFENDAIIVVRVIHGSRKLGGKLFAENGST